jgi:hypothetical protein
MRVDLHLRHPVAENHQCSRGVETRREESQEINGSHVGPVEIIDHHDQGVNGRDLFAEIRQLSFHSSWCARAGVRNLTVPGWRGISHNLFNILLFGKRAESLDPGHERLDIRQRLRAAAAREMERLAVLDEIVEENVEKRGLSEAGITTEADHAAVALPGKIVCASKLGPLMVASYDMADVDISCPAAEPAGG